MSLTSAAESLHRSQDPNARTMTAAESTKIRKAAVQAAAEIDSEAAVQVGNMLGGLGSPSYHYRLADLCDVTWPVLKDVLIDRKVWIDSVKEVRNKMAHPTTFLNDRDFSMIKYVSTSLQWVLSVRLFQAILLGDELLAGAVDQYPDYRVAVRNCQVWVGDLGGS